MPTSKSSTNCSRETSTKNAERSFQRTASGEPIAVQGLSCRIRSPLRGCGLGNGSRARGAVSARPSADTPARGGKRPHRGRVSQWRFAPFGTRLVLSQHAARRAQPEMGTLLRWGHRLAPLPARADRMQVDGRIVRLGERRTRRSDRRLPPAGARGAHPCAPPIPVSRRIVARARSVLIFRPF